MDIKINGRNWPLNITGTVGLVYLAQRILGDPDKGGETFDGNNIYHQIVLYYAALHACNKNKPDVPDLQDFMASLTSKRMKEISTFFWKRWNELEGITDADTDTEEKKDKKKGED